MHCSTTNTNTNSNKNSNNGVDQENSVKNNHHLYDNEGGSGSSSEGLSKIREFAQK